MNAPVSQAKFDLHLPGLLKVLAEHLYSDRRVGFRELLQNSHDSCSRRKIESGNDFEPTIKVTCDRKQNTLRISDNGCGLTPEEIVAYLATIGRGYTRKLREETALSEPENNRDLIGQFGLGFLSAFLVASEVEVQTLSFQPGSEPMCWKSVGSETYDMVPGNRTEVGTTVTLKCKPSMRFLLDEDVLDELVQRYCDLLPIPIVVGERSYPSNRQSAPWESQDFESDFLEFLRSRGECMAPIWMFRLEDWTLDLDHDTIQVPLSGVLYIPDASVASLHEFGDATVYIRNMFIDDKNRNILPCWAKFVRGVVESSMLQPTASREDIHADENLELVQTAIEQQLLSQLDQLSQNNRRLWNHIVNSHTDLIMGWASSSDQFFNRIAERIELQTSRGPLTIGEYLKQSNSTTIYFQTKRSPTLCEQVLLEGRSTPVIDASWFGVRAFLTRYVEEHPKLQLQQTDEDLESLMREVRHDSFAPLLAAFQSLVEEVKVAEFQPPAVPAVMLYSEYAEFIEDSSEAVENGELMPGVAEMISDYVESLNAAGENTEGILMLNASSPLVQRMAESATAGSLPEAVCQQILHSARIFSGRMMDARKCIESYESYSNAVLEQLA